MHLYLYLKNGAGRSLHQDIGVNFSTAYFFLLQVSEEAIRQLNFDALACTCSLREIDI